MFSCPLPFNLFISWVFVCISVSFCLSLISPFSLFSILSLLSFFSFTFSLCPFPSLFFSLNSPLTSLPSYPFSLSIHSPLSSLPLLYSTYSFLPSLTFFSLPSPPHSFLSFQLSLSPILSILSHLSLLYIFLLSPTPLPSLLPSLPLSLSLLSSLHAFFLYPLPSVYLNSFSLLSLLSFLPSLTSPFLFSIPVYSPLSVHSFFLSSLPSVSFNFILSPFPFSPPYFLSSHPSLLSFSCPFFLSSPISLFSISHPSFLSPHF